jgi:hypothetical protein
MSLVITKIDQMVAECESRIAEVKRQLRVFEAELDGYKAARSTLNEAGIGRRRIDEDGPFRALSDNWRSILLQIGEGGISGMSIDEIELYQNNKGYGINRNTIRSQLSIYNGKGFLERVGGGRYSLTSLGNIVANQEPKIDSSMYVVKSNQNRAGLLVGSTSVVPSTHSFTFGGRAPTQESSTDSTKTPFEENDPTLYRKGELWNDGE